MGANAEGGLLVSGSLQMANARLSSLCALCADDEVIWSDRPESQVRLVFALPVLIVK